MGLEATLSNAGVLPLLVTYQTEGPRIDYARQEAARVGLPVNVALSIYSDDPRGAVLYDPDLNASGRMKAMTPGEVACYWGHREAWRIFLQEGSAYALVVEDDFHVKDLALLEQALTSLPKIPAFDILLLRTHKPRGPVRSWPFGNFAVEDRLFGTTGATGYLITTDGARKLLSRPRIFRPVDEDFIAPWELGLRVLNLNPEPIGETDKLTSSLDGQRVVRAPEQKRPFRGMWLKMRWQLLSLFYWLMRARA